jgi:hypothetical protein
VYSVELNLVTTITSTSGRLFPRSATAVEPETGGSFCLYLPRLDAECFEVFLEELQKAYPGEEIVLVLRQGTEAAR